VAGGALPLAEAGKAPGMEAAGPARRYPEVLTEPLGHPGATEPLADEQDAMQAVIVPRLLRAGDHFLNGQAHDLW